MPRLLTNPLIPTRALRRRGYSKERAARAVETGELWHVVRGWYAEPGTDAELIRSVRLGGRLGCVSALRLYGAWTPPASGTHVVMPRSASGRRLPDADDHDLVVHWRSRLGEPKWTDGISPLDIAIVHALACQPPDMAVAVTDSLLHRGIVSTGRLAEIRGSVPRRLHTVLDSVDGRSEEGIESLTRVRLGWLGIVALPQIVIPEVGRLDLLVDGWLAIELDGRATHAQSAAFDRDRRRTALLQQRGFTVLQFTYAQVVHDWPFVEATILAALARR